MIKFILLFFWSTVAIAQWTTPIPYEASHVLWYSVRDNTGMEIAQCRGWNNCAVIWLAPELAAGIKECTTPTCLNLQQRLIDQTVRFDPICGASDFKKLQDQILLANTLRDIGYWAMDSLVSCVNLTNSNCPDQAHATNWLLWLSGYIRQRFIDGK